MNVCIRLIVGRPTGWLELRTKRAIGRRRLQKAPHCSDALPSLVGCLRARLWPRESVYVLHGRQRATGEYERAVTSGSAYSHQKRSRVHCKFLIRVQRTCVNSARPPRSFWSPLEARPRRDNTSVSATTNLVVREAIPRASRAKHD